MSVHCEAHLEHRLGAFRLEVELSLEREIGVLFGPSGAGKSLTLRILAGLLTPNRGAIRLGGRRLLEVPGGGSVPARNRRIGLVHQHLSLFPHLTVLENVSYGLRGPKRERRASSWLARMHLHGLGGAIPESSPGGNSSAWPWPGPWLRSRSCCSWTSPSVPWTAPSSAACAGS